MNNQIARPPRNTIYRSLSSSTSIRVFILQPGLGDSLIRITLVETDLRTRKHIQYDAISYTWGSPNQKRLIEVNNHEVYIRLNLWNCLKRLRLPERTRAMWADAICISQTDLVEKAQQVSIIGDTFEKAEHVIVWLGEYIDDEQTFFRERDVSEDNAEPEGQSLGFHDRMRIIKYFNRRYWHRRWIVQELIVARVIVFQLGGWQTTSYAINRTSWTELSDRLTNFYPDLESDHSACLFISHETYHAIEIARASRITRLGDTHFAARNARSAIQGYSDTVEMESRRADLLNRLGVSSQYNSTIGLGRYRWNPNSILTYIEQFSKTECENPLDQVYAVLSLAKSPSKKLPFPPDYAIGMPELIVKTCAYTIRSKQYQYVDLLEVLFRSLKFTTNDLLVALKLFPCHQILGRPSIIRATLLAISRWEIFRLPGSRHLTYDHTDPFRYAHGEYDFIDEFPVSRWYDNRWYARTGFDNKEQADVHFEEMLDLLTARQKGNLDWIDHWETRCKDGDKARNFEIEYGKKRFINYARWQQWKKSIRTAWSSTLLLSTPRTSTDLCSGKD